MGKASKVIKKAEEFISDSERMSRAKEMGFDEVPWYHGGSKGRMSEINSDLLGRNTGTPASKEGFFLTRSRDDAARYAEMSKGEIHEMLFRPDKTAVLDWGEIGVPIRSNNGQRILAGILMDAKESGFGAIRIKNSADTADGSTSVADTIAVLDPKLLRYKDAEFDPAKKESRNLMAGLAPLGVGVGSYLLPKENTYASEIPQFGQSLLGEPQAQAPVAPALLTAADYLDKYSNWRKEHIPGPINWLLPAGEPDTEYMRNRAYGYEPTTWEKFKFGLSFL